MKGAFLISPMDGFFIAFGDRLEATDLGVVERDSRVIQLRDTHDRLLTLFGDASDEWKAGFRMPSGDPAGPVPIEAVWAECRHEQLFCDVVAEVSAGMPQTVWVLDTNSIVWDATSIDRSRLRL